MKTLNGYHLILKYISTFLIMIGFIILSPLLCLFFFKEEIVNAIYFLIPGLLSIVIGGVIKFNFRKYETGNLGKRHDLITILLAWLLAIIVSAIPFVLSGHYNFVQAIFETTSAYSTTGLSVYDFENSSKLFLMYRSIMLFVGGVGLMLVLMSVIFDKYGMRLYSAEGHTDKLLPSILKSARIIFTIYFGYIISGTIIYFTLGMNWFDAVNHSIAAFSTGGFSTHPENLGYFNSFAIEAATIVFMLLGGTNFYLHLLLLKRQFRRFIYDCEVQFMLLLVGLLVPVFGFIIMYGMGKTISESLWIALFHGISAFTTTGFNVIPDFTLLPSAGFFLMIVLMLIGGGAGSTAGGIKQFRVVSLFKQTLISLKSRYTNRRVKVSNQVWRYGKKMTISDIDNNQNHNFLILYLMIFTLGTFIFTLYGYSLEQSMFEFASSMGTVGLGVGITGYDAPNLVLITSAVGMLLGRLEIIIIFVAISQMISDFKRRI